MRFPIIIGTLLSVVLFGTTGCPRTPGPQKPPRNGESTATVPEITQTSFPRQRDRFDALALDAPERTPLRNGLLRYLFHRLDQQLAQGDQPSARKTFNQCLKLFDAREIYRGGLRHARLSETAARMVKLASPSGNEVAVLIPLAVQITLQPERKELRQEFATISKWMRETAELVGGKSRRWLRTIRVLEKVVKVWPARFVVEALRKAYIEQRLTIAKAFNISRYSHLSGAVEALFRTGLNVARMYLLVDEPKLALRRLEEVASERGADEQLRTLLQRAVVASASPDQQVELAEFFKGRDRNVALRVCRAALRRFPKSAKVYGCVGRLAAALERTSLSIVNLEHAVRLDPGNRTYVELLAQQYQRRLFHLIGAEKLDLARKELARIEVFYKERGGAFKTPIRPPLSRVYHAIGHGLYNAGRIEHAREAFEKSVRLTPTSAGYLQLATIYLKRGKLDQAASNLDKAEALAMPSAHARTYWQGRIEALRGELYQRRGAAAKSRKAFQRAVTAWRELQALGLSDEDKAEAYVYEARSLFALDELAKGMRAVDRAIDVMPDRKETYADVIALLTTRGHLPEALDAYHRALGRREVSEYLKSYCSFWVIDLARRAGLPPDPLAVRHLENLKRAEWYAQLARLVLGQASYDDLRAAAHGPSNLAELYFYQAQRKLAAGELKQARQLWKKVLETEMMAFYEYDMADYNLRNGPAKVQTAPIDRQQPSAYLHRGTKTPQPTSEQP